jgi:hypothetical protein
VVLGKYFLSCHLYALPNMTIWYYWFITWQFKARRRRKRGIVKNTIHALVQYEMSQVSGFVVQKWALERSTYALVPKRLNLWQEKQGFSLTQTEQPSSEPLPVPLQSVHGVVSVWDYIFANVRVLYMFATKNASLASGDQDPDIYHTRSVQIMSELLK